MVSKTYQAFRDMLLTRLDEIEKVSEAIAGGDPKLGKLLLQAGEFLDAGELKELHEVIGLDAQRRERFHSSYTLCAFQALNKS